MKLHRARQLGEQAAHWSRAASDSHLVIERPLKGQALNDA
jgi:hypothetical protein